MMQKKFVVLALLLFFASALADTRYIATDQKTDFTRFIAPSDARTQDTGNYTTINRYNSLLSPRINGTGFDEKNNFTISPGTGISIVTQVNGLKLSCDLNTDINFLAQDVNNAKFLNGFSLAQIDANNLETFIKKTDLNAQYYSQIDANNIFMQIKRDENVSGDKNFQYNTDTNILTAKKLTINGTVIAEQITEGSVLWTGTESGTGVTPTSGPGIRVMWIPAKGAFRAGLALGNEWNDANIGLFTTVFGQGNKATGATSFASGSVNTVTGYNSAVFGFGSTVSGQYALGAGYVTTASGDYSSAFGQYSEATGEASFAVGTSSLASNIGSFAWGDSTEASGYYSVCGGISNTASGYRAVVLAGEYNVSDQQDGVILGGTQNSIDAGLGGSGSLIGGGSGNYISALTGVIIGGEDNTITGNSGLIGGGEDHVVSGIRASIVGGRQNIASGSHSFIGGGRRVETSGSYSGTPIGYASDVGTMVNSALRGVSAGYDVMAGDGTVDNTSDVFAFGRNFTNSTTDSFGIGFGQLDFLFTAKKANFYDANIITTQDVNVNNKTIIRSDGNITLKSPNGVNWNTGVTNTGVISTGVGFSGTKMYLKDLMTTCYEDYNSGSLMQIRGAGCP